MTQEEKQVLLKDLCARLPYEVKFILSGGNVNNIYTMKGIDLIATDEGVWDYGVTTKNTEPIEIKYIKPYLRPMSSMTEEEKKIMRSCGFELISYDTGCIGFANIENYIDEVSFRFMEEFLNSHHFDYRGLIEEGLALEATENMYKTE